MPTERLERESDVEGEEGSPLLKDELVESETFKDELDRLKEDFGTEELERSVSELVNSDEDRLRGLGNQMERAYEILDKEKPDESLSLWDYEDVLDKAWEKKRINSFKDSLTDIGIEEDKIKGVLEGLDDHNWFSKLKGDSQEQVLDHLKEMHENPEKEKEEIVEDSTISVSHVGDKYTEVDEMKFFENFSKGLVSEE